MKYYAYLNKEGYCNAIVHLSREIPLKEDMVIIEDYNLNYLNRKYDLGAKKWTNEYLQVQIEEDINKQEVINAQIISDLEYLKCLAELNSMKGRNL